MSGVTHFRRRLGETKDDAESGWWKRGRERWPVSRRGCRSRTAAAAARDEKARRSQPRTVARAHRITRIRRSRRCRAAIGKTGVCIFKPRLFPLVQSHEARTQLYIYRVEEDFSHIAAYL